MEKQKKKKKKWGARTPWSYLGLLVHVNHLLDFLLRRELGHSDRHDGQQGHASEGKLHFSQAR